MSYLNISKFNDFLSQGEEGKEEKLPDVIVQKEYPEDKNGQLRLELVNG